MTSLCLSMLDQSTPCNSAACRHSHKCPCGGSCVSAAKCPKFDQSTIDAKYGSDIAQMRATRRAAGRRPG